MPPEAPVDVGIATFVFDVGASPIVEVAFTKPELELFVDENVPVTEVEAEPLVEEADSVKEVTDDWRFWRVGLREVVAFEATVVAESGVLKEVAVDAVTEYRAEESTL